MAVPSPYFTSPRCPKMPYTRGIELPPPRLRCTLRNWRKARLCTTICYGIRMSNKMHYLLPGYGSKLHMSKSRRCTGDLLSFMRLNSSD
ncbi:hypothetical protein ARMGADRAFT_89712 [Armillaria gallica]|uniref:Uncharacterized protein n=1 Tax=Armillaria gallica TaxID=47427 RepID=A0A2H3DTV6_ARMGA|nr:hypothetical protein ARMGADRAFT_89712 [Armillaria gallica]